MIEIIVFILLSEVVFRLWHQLKFARPYHVSIKMSWRDSYVDSHPFLSFSYKKNITIDKNQRLPYPLHTNKFFSFKEPLRINNFGHFG